MTESRTGSAPRRRVDVPTVVDLIGCAAAWLVHAATVVVGLALIGLSAGLPSERLAETMIPALIGSATILAPTSVIWAAVRLRRGARGSGVASACLAAQVVVVLVIYAALLSGL